MDLEKLAALLAAETYPHVHIHKFIGGKTAAFLSAVSDLERSFPAARRVGSRESQGSQGRVVYLALTYEMNAHSADEIIDLYRATAALPDLKIIL